MHSSLPILDIELFSEIISAIADEISQHQSTNVYSFKILSSIISTRSADFEKRVNNVVLSINFLFERALDIVTDENENEDIADICLQLMISLLSSDNYQDYIEKTMHPKSIPALLSLSAKPKLSETLFYFLTKLIVIAADSSVSQSNVSDPLEKIVNLHFISDNLIPIMSSSKCIPKYSFLVLLRTMLELIISSENLYEMIEEQLLQNGIIDIII